MQQYLPILKWGRQYNRKTFVRDLLAACIVVFMLIPQSLAYALLAGLPAEFGLYASILPLIAYGLFGTSRTLAVGPVAVISLMAAAAIGGLGITDLSQMLVAAATLAILSGLLLVLLGLLRLGFLANALSHPVIAGFITASAIIIAIGQLKHVLGIAMAGDALPELLSTLAINIDQFNTVACGIGLSVIVFLWWARKYLQALVERLGVNQNTAGIIAKTGPVFAIIFTTFLAHSFELGERYQLGLVGQVPNALPSLSLPTIDRDLLLDLLIPATLIAIVGFVESISVAHTLAAKRRQRIEPNQELIALGAANLAAGLSQGFPVTGGFSRSVVNFDAGAETPAAGIFTAIGIAIATMLIAPILTYLPKATLAATIIVAVMSLIDFSILKKTWHYSRADFLAIAATILTTLILGVKWGICSGVALSIVVHLLKTARPHIAVVGQVPGTEHYRNIDRHDVFTLDHIVSLRVDESLYFINSRFLEDKIYNFVADNKNIKHVVLQCNAINSIDYSALESLEAINQHLQSAGVCLHLSEVKGPVMDKLQGAKLLQKLSGKVFLTQHQAIKYLMDLEEGSNIHSWTI